MKDQVVCESTEDEDGRRCVDIFRRADGSFGFEEYVREPEDNRGWQPSGFTGHLRFETFKQAQRKAADFVGWYRPES